MIHVGRKNAVLCAALSIALCLCPRIGALRNARADAPRETVRAVALLGSFAESWILAGGALVGTTEDAVSERRLALDEGVQIVGTTKSPNLELILALTPDVALLSSEISGQTQLREALEAAGIVCLAYSVNTYPAYLEMMRELCALTGRMDLYEAQVQAVQTPIEALLSKVKQSEAYGKRTLLLIRAYASGARAKNSDNLAGAMLRDLGLVNIADGERGILENLTMEAILLADPDCIFITTMGSGEEAALRELAEGLMANPAWQGLRAVGAGRVYILPQALFHYKPNARWPESYEYLRDILYPELSGESLEANP